MEIILSGHQRCNLYVGGDRRDKSIQSVFEGTEHKNFYLVKLDNGDFEVWQADEIPILPHSTKEKPRIVKRSKGKKKNGK